MSNTNSARRRAGAAARTNRYYKEELKIRRTIAFSSARYLLQAAAAFVIAVWSWITFEVNS